MKTAFITGAGGGIGSAITKKFIDNGYFVVGQYNTNKKAIDELVDELGDKKDYFFPVQSDFDNMDSVDEMMDKVEKSFHHFDVLINNAGVGLYKLITDTTDNEWDKLFNVNMKSAFKITNRVLKGMIDRKSGKIINISSMWGVCGASMEVGYSASKSALIGYTKALAKEVGPSGINVNCICPGVIDTRMNDIFSAEDKQILIEETPLGRMGKGVDIAELCYFLASESASFITGQIITCDGGFSL